MRRLRKGEEGGVNGEGASANNKGEAKRFPGTV